MNNPVIYTVGHSTHTLEYFLELLRTYSINCLVDVRSFAMSGYNPQYNQTQLSSFLKANGVAYMHFDEEFGARRNDPDLLDEDGKVNFDLVRKSWIFNKGIERLWQGLEKKFTIALMCSESDPFECHRFSMISPALTKEGMDVRHILKDKSLFSNEELERQLLEKYADKIPQPNIFNPAVTPEEQLAAAYRLRNIDIAYSPLRPGQTIERYD